MKKYILFFIAFINLSYSEMANYFFDDNHVRYELVSTKAGGSYNWLFFPGGPGADSSYLRGLVELLDLPGNVWLIDLPGNGENIEGISADYDFNQWFDIFLPTIKKFKNPILVGHSFGGMFPLLFPEMEDHLKGFVILNSSPTLWLEEAVSYSQQFNLPDLSKEMEEFTKKPSQSTFDHAINACMPYYFPKETLDKGRIYLSSTMFRFQPAVWWQRKAIELNYSAQWIPQNIPTLIVGCKYDCICPFTLFQNDKRFNRSNIELVYIEDAGHIGWIENPAAMIESFDWICKRLKPFSDD